MPNYMQNCGVMSNDVWDRNKPPHAGEGIHGFSHALRTTCLRAVHVYASSYRTNER